MKKAIKRVLVSGLLMSCGALMNAQTVTFLMNDNTSYKYNTDRVKTISVVSAGDEAPVVEMTSVTVEVYGNNAVLHFANVDKSVKIDLDLYGPTDAMYLNAGNYEVKTGGGAFTIDPNGGYTLCTLGGTKLNIASGLMKVAMQGRNYEISGDFILENGDRQAFTFIGPLPTYSAYKEFKIAGASYNENPQQPGVFYVKMSDSSSSIEMALVMVCDPAATVLQSGSYVRATDATKLQPGTYITGSYIDLFKPYFSDREFTGTCTVACEGEIYSIDFEATLSNGQMLAITYEGKINGTPTFQDAKKESSLKKGPANMFNR